MALLSIDTLYTALTKDGVKAQIYALAEALGLSPTSWIAGAPTRTIIAILSPLFAGWDAFRVALAKGGFLDDAEGGWLDLLARLVYGVTPIAATYATGEVVVDNTGGGVYSFDPGDVVFRNSTTGKTYVNADAFTVASLETDIAVAVRATELGTIANAAPGQIDALETTVLGLVVTNPLAVLGTDEETPESIRERCLDSLGALSPNGPAAAYAYVAKTPELNGGVAVTRVRVLNPSGDGSLTVLVAGPGGPLSPSDVTLIQGGVDLWAEPLGVTATVASATERAITVTTTVHVDAAEGIAEADWVAAIKAQLLAYVARLPIGGLELAPGDGRVLWRALIGQIEELDGVLQATLSPEADVLLADTEVATLADADITVTVVQVVS